MHVSTAFQLQGVDGRDLALRRMKKPWYRCLDRNEEWKERMYWVIIYTLKS